MSPKRIGVLAGTVLAGGLLLAVAGTAVAQSPSSAPAATQSIVPGPMGAMMGAGRVTASAAPGHSAAPTPTFGAGMMGSAGHGMDADDVTQMQTWMNQAGSQHQAMHTAMTTQGCSPAVMRGFLASPAPTK